MYHLFKLSAKTQSRNAPRRQQFHVAPPRAKLVAPLCRYTRVTRKVPFKLRPKDRKGAPLCRYTGVTRKVPLSSAPKIGKRCPMGTEKVSCPEGKQKPRKQRNKIWEDRAVTPLRKTETACDLIFSTHASERTWDNCVSGVELDKITGCLAYLQQ